MSGVRMHLLVLLALLAFAPANVRALDCEGSADTGCLAFGFLEITSTQGECTGTASASCEAVSASQNAMKEAYDEWWGEGEAACNRETIEVAATAVAVAIAEVWVSAAAQVSCTGYGFGCGWSITGGNAYALGFAEALAAAAAEASAGIGASGLCYADIRAVSTVLATAAANAQTEVCQEGEGSEEGYQEAYVETVKVAIADAFASATASACIEGDAVNAMSLCTGDASSTSQEGITNERGDECAGTRQLKECTGGGEIMCCARDFDRNQCSCNDCDGPWIRKSNRGDAKKVFENGSNELCFCLDTEDQTSEQGASEEEGDDVGADPESEAGGEGIEEADSLDPEDSGEGEGEGKGEGEGEGSDDASTLDEGTQEVEGGTEQTAEAGTDGTEDANGQNEGTPEIAGESDEITSGGESASEGAIEANEGESEKPAETGSSGTDDASEATEGKDENAGETDEMTSGDDGKAEEPEETAAASQESESDDQGAGETTGAEPESTGEGTGGSVPATDKGGKGGKPERKEVKPCEGAVDTSCKAFANLRILTTAGSCQGVASADCQAIQSSISQYQEAFDEWFTEDGTCEEAKAKAAATAVARATARVWANAATKVTCEGLGYACGWSITGASAWAVGFAEALAQAAAEAGGGGAEGFCYADIRAVSVVVAEAVADSQSQACTTGGTVEDYEENYAAAIEVGIANAFAEATASACDAGDALTAKSRCVGNASSRIEEEKYATDDACAGIEQPEACKGPGKDMCCDPRFTRSLCVCNRKGCKHGPWTRRTKENLKDNTKRSFENRKKEICYCLD